MRQPCSDNKVEVVALKPSTTRNGNLADHARMESDDKGTNVFPDSNGYRTKVSDLNVDLVMTGSDTFRPPATWAVLNRFNLVRVVERAARIASAQTRPSILQKRTLDS